MSVSYYIEQGQDDLEIDRRMIDACSDADRLAEWVAGLEDSRDAIQMQTAAFHMAPKTDSESLRWLAAANQALAATGIGITRVNQRRRALGFIHNPMSSQIARLEEKLLNAKARIAELEGAAK
jgi:hypothetical protein